MTPEAAWAEAMRFENRANPFPFFDELRRTPVARVHDDLYVVTGYRELRTLLHDPRLSADASRSPLMAKTTAAPPPDDLAVGYAPKQSFIASDPPDHDRMRRQVMRHFAPRTRRASSRAPNRISSSCATTCSTRSRPRVTTGLTLSMNMPIRCRCR